MITSKRLTFERLKEIKNFPITYDEDSPKLTPEQIARLQPAHKELHSISKFKGNVYVKIDEDILRALQTFGKDYQSKINEILREAVIPAINNK